MGSGCGGRYRAPERIPEEKSWRQLHEKPERTPKEASHRVVQPTPIDINSAGAEAAEEYPAVIRSVSVAELKQRLRDLGRKIPDGAIEKGELLALVEDAQKDSTKREAARAAKLVAPKVTLEACPTSPVATPSRTMEARMSPSPKVAASSSSPAGHRSVADLKKRLREFNLEIPINIVEKKDLVALVEAAEKQLACEQTDQPGSAAKPRSVAQLKGRLQELGVKVPTGAVEKRELFILLEEAERRQDGHRPATSEGTPSNKVGAKMVQCEKGCGGVTAITVNEDPATPASPSNAHIVKGQKFIWTKGRLIGRGSLGLVYRGETAEGQVIAVKDVALDMEDKFREDLENEIQIMQDLTHPYVVSYLGHDYVDDHLYMYLDFMPGGSLSGVLKEHGPLDESLVVRYAKQLLSGLEYLHMRQPPVIHRDIKGANVLVDACSNMKWADFGCSKRGDSDKTQTMLRGSVPWMAPEVVASSRYGKTSDVWSFGCLLIEMGTARTPWGTFDNQVQALIKIGMSRETPPLPEGISDECQGFISQCIQRDFQLRPSATELLRNRILRDVALPL